MKKIKKFLCIATLISLFIPQCIFAQEDFTKNNEFLVSVKEYILKNYDGEITDEELVQGAINGMFDKADRYSVYMEVDQSQKFKEEVEGKLFGIGASLSLKDGQVKIAELLEDSPAAKIGVFPGDIIISINQEKLGFLNSLDPIIDKIKGGKGTPVNIGINRDGQILSFEIIRDEIKINPVRYKILDESKKIGYLKINEFNANVVNKVDIAVDDLLKQDIKKLILDLRGNPGGGLSEVAKVSQRFIPTGDIVSVKYKNGKNIKIVSSGKAEFDELVVLIDSNSASASEILAGAIQDRKVGILVGEKSLGKGTVQNVLSLKNGDSIKLTVGRYYLPSGRTIDHTGLIPDFEVERINPNINLSNMIKLDVQKEIKEGDNGVNVVALQQRLENMGYGVKVTGIFDDQTKTALGILESGYGLERDEIGDLETLRKVNQKFSEFILSENNDMQLKKAIEILSE